MFFDLLFDDLSWLCCFGGLGIMFGLYRTEFLPILGLARFFLGFWNLNKFAFLVLFCLVGGFVGGLEFDAVVLAVSLTWWFGGWVEIWFV